MTNKMSCPLCEENNKCQINDPTTTCWCSTYTFPEHFKEKLKQLPKQCICSTCAQKLGAIKNDSI